MKAPRHVYTIFCDDVRAEIGNKLSLMGCYDSALVVAQFPITLSKLCFVMTATSHADRPFKQLKFRLYKNEELLNEIEIDASQLAAQALIDAAPPEGTDLLARTMQRAVVQISPLVLDAPCYFKVRVLTEEDEPLRGGALQIMLATHSDGASLQLPIPMENPAE